MRLSRLTNRQLHNLINSGHIVFANQQDSETTKKLLNYARNYRYRVLITLKNNQYKRLFNSADSMRNNPAYKETLSHLFHVQTTVGMIKDELTEMTKDLEKLL